jgi:GT2 family glycosyltransferase
LLYFKNIVLCLRASLKGFQLRFETDIRVVHDALGDSYRLLRRLSSHHTSLGRLWRSATYRDYRVIGR